MSDVPLKLFRCISLDLAEDFAEGTDGLQERQCEKRARFIIEGEAGWSGKHCRRHALRVISTMLSQVEAAGYSIRIRKFNP